MTLKSLWQSWYDWLKKIAQSDWQGLLIIAVVWVIFFSPLLSGKYVYFLDDLKIIYHPLEYEYSHFQHAWQLPEWSTTFGFGQPLLGWGQLGFFTPVHLILRALFVPPLLLLQLSIGIYFGLGLLGAYAFARGRSFSQYTAAIFSLLFAFCGFAIGHINHVNFYTTTMLLPWLLLAGDKLLNKPTWAKGAALAAMAAIMAVSGQPQIILYSFTIALFVLIPQFLATVKKMPKPWQHTAFIIGITVVAGAVALCLASLNLLPLREFLPQTERNGALPPEEYYEFSYPPYHAITLILPYFYGDHESYWGAKGFQELAAFVGVAPLFLVFVAVTTWKTRKTERITSLILIAIATVMALGKYSPLYTYLVEHHFMPPLAVPGRFVFFFDVGIALLAAVGAEDVIASLKRRSLAISTGIIGLALICTPFFIHMSVDGRSFEEFRNLFIRNGWELLPVVIGLLVIPLIALASRYKFSEKLIAILISITVAIPLLFYSWSYNPRQLTSVALADNKFADDLRQYSASQPIPPRLYSHDRLLQDVPSNQNIRRTDPISPAFSVIQPVQTIINNWQCVSYEAFVKDNRQGQIVFGIHTNLDSAPIREITISATDMLSSEHNRVCFDPITDSANKTYYVSVKSYDTTGVQIIYTKNEDTTKQAFFIRTAAPTPKEIALSQKVATLHMEPVYTTIIDREVAMLARHVQVTANTSSARWIGALSIRPYRQFIETFFANDGEVIDGDGHHAIERNRTILDMVGVTHLIQSLPPEATDTMADAGFITLDSYHTGEKLVRLYRNPTAWPKAFLVPNAEFRPAADETRFGMMQPEFDPASLVYLSGDGATDNLPAALKTHLTDSGATITKYTPTQVDVDIKTSREAFLVLTDSTTEQWHTYIDGQLAPYLVGDSVFKTAQVPSGTHTVSFRYESAATKAALKISLIGIIVWLLMLLPLAVTTIKKTTSPASVKA